MTSGIIPQRLISQRCKIALVSCALTKKVGNKLTENFDNVSFL